MASSGVCLGMLNVVFYLVSRGREGEGGRIGRRERGKGVREGRGRAEK